MASLLTKVKAKIEITTTKKVRGLISGRGRSLFKGSGEDFDDLKYYQPGDKISDIDWKATARSGEPLIRQFNEERVRYLCVIGDTSGAMAASAADGTSKRDALVTAAGLLCYLAHSNGDLVGLVAGTPGDQLQLPARSSRGHLELLLRTLQKNTVLGGAPANIEWALTRALRLTRRSSLMLLITDEANPGPECEGALRRLMTRHDLLVVRIRDADPLGRLDLDAALIDPGYPREILRHTRTVAAVHKEADAFREKREADITAMLDSLGIVHTLTDGDSQIVDDMIAMFRRQGARNGRP
ncbi:DUF58 domain-containing protein [Dermabacter hominis]|uniref:DUF58 domain-containing protein n=1 Tax=Dermabacter hominis TaxID=36740 RepID=UPI000C79063D